MKYRFHVWILVAAMAAVVLPAGLLHAQVSPSERDRALREARDLARMGNHEAAIRKVESLYARAPLDGTVVQGLARLLAEAGELERAKEVLTSYAAVRGDDNKAMAALASLHFRTGESGKGMEILDTLVARDPKEVWPYHIGLNVLVDNGMSEATIDLIARARKAVGDSTLFAVEAARVHRELEQFGRATHEYLLAGTAKNMSPEIATEYIVGMARDDMARPAVTGTLENMRAIKAFSRAIALSLGEIYLMDSDCAHAFQMISELVEADPANAGILIAFAQRASGAGCNSECAKAYELVLGHLDNDQKKAEYLIAKAHCEERAGMLEDALSTFDAVAREYEAFKYADEALMGRARILRDMGKVEEAVAEAERVMGSSYSDNVSQAIIFQGDCRVLQGRLDDAFETYDLVGTDWVPQYAQEAFFNLGEISLYRGEFDEAQSYYNVTLRQYPDEPRANDAIDRLLLIKSAGGDGSYDPRLQRLGRALLLMRQGRRTEAAEILKEIGAMEGESPIRVESLMLLSEIYVRDGSFDDAIRTYKMVGDSLGAPASPLALEAVGDIYLRLGEIEEAVKAYEDLILKFPASVSAGEARRKIDLATKEPDDEA